METEERAPTHALRPFVDRFWSLRVARGERITFAEVLPGTGAELMVHLGEPARRAGGAPLPSSHLLCLRATTLGLEAPSSGLDLFAVRFRAGAIRHFIDADVSAVADAHASFDDLAGSASGTLREALGEQTDFESRVALAEGVLVGLAAQFVRADALVDRAVRRIYRANGRVPIVDVARDLGVTPRHLARRFAASAGVSPKELARLVRFSKTVRALVLGPRTELARAAVEHGYFDHAHFAHEFRSVAGQAPSTYLRAAAQRSHFYKRSIGG